MMILFFGGNLYGLRIGLKKVILSNTSLYLPMHNWISKIVNQPTMEPFSMSYHFLCETIAGLSDFWRLSSDFSRLDVPSDVFPCYQGVTLVNRYRGNLSDALP